MLFISMFLCVDDLRLYVYLFFFLLMLHSFCTGRSKRLNLDIWLENLEVPNWSRLYNSMWLLCL